MVWRWLVIGVTVAVLGGFLIYALVRGSKSIPEER